MKRYELVEGKAAKFWQWEVRGARLVVEYGRIGAAGQSTVKEFGTEAEANAAAAKLVKEKVGKGYRLIGEAGGADTKPVAVVATPKAPVTPPPAAAAPEGSPSAPPPLRFIDEAGLASLAATLGKKSKKAPRDIVEARVGDSRWKDEHRAAETIAAMLERGLLPKKLILELVYELSWVAERMTPRALLDLIAALPATEGSARCVLEGYSAEVDRFLMNAVHRGSELVAQTALPPHARRALPLVKRRLGLSDEAIPSELAAELVRFYLHGPASVTVEQGGALAQAPIASYADAKAWAAGLGLGDTWDELVIAGARQHGFSTLWRAEPLLLKVPVAELPPLLRRDPDVSGRVLLACLEIRRDSPEALLELLDALVALESPNDAFGHFIVRELVAVAAGAQLAAAGKEIPPRLVEEIWLREGVRSTEHNLAYTLALAAFPREQVLGRVAAVLAHEHPEVRCRVPIGLAAHFDATSLAKHLDTADSDDWSNRLPLEALPMLVERYEATEPGSPAWRLALSRIQGLLSGHSERTQTPLDPAHERFFEPKLVQATWRWKTVVRQLPVERRDALIVGWAKLDPYENQMEPALCSDAGLRAVIGEMFAKRHETTVFVRYPMGASHSSIHELLSPIRERARPMIREQFLAHRDAAAEKLLEYFPLTDAERAELIGGAAVAPRAALSAATAAELVALLDEMEAAKPATSIKSPSGRLCVSELSRSKPLGKKAARGTYKVFAHYSEGELEGATAGLDAIAVATSKQPVASWEEVLDPSGEALLGSNVISLFIGDEKYLDDLDDERLDQLQTTIDGITAYGEGVADDNGEILCLYVGEEATAHRLYWGLDAAGEPARLIARFYYQD